MITPADIQKKAFTKGVRGYKEEEVDSFLDLITLDMDKLIQENNILSEKIRTLNVELERYRNSESSIFDTLESAKALMADISASAEKRAEIVLKNAELDADRMQREARESVERLTEEAVDMSRRWEQFKTRYRSLLENELERFENLAVDFMSDSDAHRVRFYSDTLPGTSAEHGGESADADDFDIGKTIIKPGHHGR
ncbi:MAG: DivIVA domain-containing protein [Clostridiales Family XIII bacterium]|jgi:cell division initiation protein|nr:DivIVA domain-containing protein [Clostridiales Family XIII bacterium]